MKRSTWICFVWRLRNSHRSSTTTSSVCDCFEAVIQPVPMKHACSFDATTLQYYKIAVLSRQVSQDIAQDIIRLSPPPFSIMATRSLITSTQNVDLYTLIGRCIQGRKEEVRPNKPIYYTRVVRWNKGIGNEKLMHQTRGPHRACPPHRHTHRHFFVFSEVASKRGIEGLGTS